MFDGVEPVNAESELSEMLAVTPTIPHSSNGAACHRTIPPKPLNDRLSLALVVTALRCGLVPAKLNVIAPTCAAGESEFIGPSEAGAARAVGVAPKVLSRANIMTIGELALPWPPISISCTSRPLAAFTAPMNIAVLFAIAVVSAVAVGDQTGTWKVRFAIEVLLYGMSNFGGLPRGFPERAKSTFFSNGV